MNGIFDGLKVLDCASFIAAPAAATVLSDFGADVIKIEPPGAGDPYRNLPKLPGFPKSPHNYAWLMESRNKKSLALDLAKPEGKAVLRRLVADADVFITNFPPAVRARLGVSYADLGPLNARLIYACFTGYGDRGEEANKPGFDSNAYWARSGLMDLVRADGDTTPARSIAGMGDHPCAMALYGAIVTALYQRERTGRGAHVKSNLMANGMWASSVLAQAKLCGATFEERRPRERALNALVNHYRCRDGRWIILSLLNEDKQWPTLAKCLGRADLTRDPRFSTTAERHARSVELIAIFDAIFATRDLAQWRQDLDGNGLVFGVVGILDDIPTDQQMLDNDVLVPFENDTLLTVNSPIWIEGRPKVQPRHPPAIGQHSDEILRDAGFDDAAIAQLRAAGTVG
ncbi:crotonobetainyl-CoA:carnitine CoA-transferase CaiB-like acyl-CoA transferase [Rhodopseudomonas rhenobacensis]|uniref:Crotonobetainyl-CoA:carnitine CoA-transferase CaiB-like acyl-CoA transferase n=1 Tax=Rhodopseudomonas rhenobacensis TaxID=87461 RepID=A0A7W7Z827_9BRAD|nr:CaiB/BaiF CoA-transferase family protein [Rhodopseudomonas rhenobacensis]MBB5049747.1 crotonobetainyl-CoA:carnitine CoA-transferase CaiB-like acyl-CoA transferase [Rhodopseudomonas rhenobacensis]